MELLKQAQLHKSVQIYTLASRGAVGFPAVHIALNSGTMCERLPRGTPSTYCEEGWYFPKNDWHLASASELAILVNSHPVAESCLAESALCFSLPDRLHTQFWDLDIVQLLARPDTTSPEYNSKYRIFTADVINYLINDVGFAISGQCSCTTIINKPGLRSTRYDLNNNLYIGLDVDNLSRLPIAQRHLSQATAYINFGDEESYVFFINLTLSDIYNILKIDVLSTMSEPITSPSLLTKMFMAKFPMYPVISIALQPGAGLLMPTENVIYDMGTLGKSEPDMLLQVRADFSMLVVS